MTDFDAEVHCICKQVADSRQYEYSLVILGGSSKTDGLAYTIDEDHVVYLGLPMEVASKYKHQISDLVCLYCLGHVACRQLSDLLRKEKKTLANLCCNSSSNSSSNVKSTKSHLD